MRGSVARQQQKEMNARGRRQAQVGKHKTDRREVRRSDGRKERTERFRRCREGSH